MKNQDNLDDILAALAVSNIPSTSVTEKKPTEEYDEKAELISTLRGLDDLINMNSKVLDEARHLLESTGDADFFDVYANLGKAQSEAFKNKVKILTDKEKNKILKDTKNKELEIKEKVADHMLGKLNSGSGNTLNQTNVVISTSREEMFEMLLKMKQQDKEFPRQMEEATEAIPMEIVDEDAGPQPALQPES